MPKRRCATATAERLVDAVRAVGAWLIAEALVETTIERLFDGMCAKLQAAGLDLRRATLSISTLHPMLEARAFIWLPDQGLTVDQFEHGSQTRAQWMESPFRHMLEDRQWILRRRLAGPKAQIDFPLLGQVRDLGATA